MGSRIKITNFERFVRFRAPWQFQLLRRVQMPMANLYCSLALVTKLESNYTLLLCRNLRSRPAEGRPRIIMTSSTKITSMFTISAVHCVCPTLRVSITIQQSIMLHDT